MKFYVGGSLREVPRDPEGCHEFVAALGAEIVRAGHVLLNGCRSSLDREIAASAHEWLSKNGGDPEEHILSCFLRNETAVHQFGRVRCSALEDWQMSHPELEVPEQIELADASIFLDGNEGTF